MLIFSKDPSLVRQVEEVLQDMRLPTVSLSGRGEIAAFFERRRPEIALIDTKLGEETATQICVDLRRKAGPDELAILLLVGEEMEDRALTALLAAGVEDLVGQKLKPLSFKARVSAHLARIAAAKELALKVHDSEVLIDVTSRLVSSADILDNLYDVAMFIARELHVDRCSVVLVRPQRDFGLVVASSDDPELRSLAINLKHYPEITSALDRGAPLVISDVADSDLLRNVLPTLKGARVASVALFPIARQEETLGVIFLRFKDRRVTFEKREMVFCQTVANAASIALRNAEILELLKAKNREIEKVQIEARSLKQYEEFFIGALEGMVALEQSGTVVFINPKAVEMLGEDTAAVRGRPFADLLAPEERAEFENLLDEFTRGEARRSVDFTLGRSGRTNRVISISAGSLFGEEGMMLLTVRDVTDERDTERRLAEAQRRLVLSEKQAAMAELAGAAAHELNQPLTSVMTSLAMLRRLLEGNAREQQIVDTIEQESERMASIIRRMGKITNYTTKSYVGEAKIIDLDGAYVDEGEGEER
jgi:PAS domain S-box-containing protein